MNSTRRPRFLKPSDGFEPSTSRPCMQDRVNETAIESTTVVNNPYITMSLQQQRAQLPIFKMKKEILYLLERHQTLVIVGETGCGKSTQIPQFLEEFGWADDGRVIGISQPRRVAVITLANRVAEESQCVLGDVVGYAVRFDDCTTERTRIKYLTDGLLVREVMADPLLTKYSVVMIDEAHERSIQTDLLCALLRKVLLRRPELRLIISSATLDAEIFKRFFNFNENPMDASADTSVALSVEGRMHPVQILYTKTAVPNYVQSTVTAVINIHKQPFPGDILCFLTGMEQVESVCQMLRDEAKRLKNVDRMWVVPLYGSLPFKEQLKAFDSTPAGTRKVVVATNVAEASVTITGVVFVVDCGFVRLRTLNSTTGIETLMTVPISRASAEQRAGRAGRLRPGRAYRLYSETEYTKLMPSTVPEMQRCDLAPVILQLKALGVDNVHKFHYIARPSTFAMIRGLEHLYALSCIDRHGQLTDAGTKMAEFPLTPQHAKCLFMSCETAYGCSHEMLSILAMLQIQNVFVFPPGSKHRAEVTKRKFSVVEGDHLTLLNVFAAFVKNGKSQKWCSDHFLNYRGLSRAVEIRAQLERLLRRYELPIKSCAGDAAEGGVRIRRCLVTGMFANAARLHHTGTYRTIRENYELRIHKGSAICYNTEKFPDWIIFGEVLQDSMRDVSAIESDWLYELAPQYYEFGTALQLAAKRARLHLN